MSNMKSLRQHRHYGVLSGVINNWQWYWHNKSCNSTELYSEWVIVVKSQLTYCSATFHAAFLLKPYLYTFSLYENPSFIIFSAETIKIYYICYTLYLIRDRAL
jgi:hypothetical protein